MLRILFLSFLVFFSQNIFAQQQNGITADVNVSATIVQSIELVTVNSMQLGNTQPEQQEIYINPIHDPNAAYMIAIGMPNSEFRLTYLPERELTHSEGNASLTFIYEISGNEVENQSTSELLENDNRNILFNSEGRYYIWVGGRINLENAQPGNYEGDFTIEIDYI